MYAAECDCKTWENEESAESGDILLEVPELLMGRDAVFLILSDGITDYNSSDLVVNALCVLDAHFIQRSSGVPLSSSVFSIIAGAYTYTFSAHIHTQRLLQSNSVKADVQWWTDHC